ncbi:MAG TPA: hypothetical protein VMC09_15515 [Anaerolineales bacterium]|nr:hypothetical protein [Anaerolineales bacterium]
MDYRKKFWLVLIGAVLGLAIIACSCGSLSPSSLVPTAASSSSGGQGPMPGLVGKWLDPDTTGTITTIEWQNNEYVVTSVSNPDRGGNEVTKSSWSNNVLTWTYCIPGGNCITSVTTGLSGDSLDTTWSDDRGYSGTTTFQRQP